MLFELQVQASELTGLTLSSSSMSPTEAPCVGLRFVFLPCWVTWWPLTREQEAKGQRWPEVSPEGWSYHLFPSHLIQWALSGCIKVLLDVIHCFRLMLSHSWTDFTGITRILLGWLHIFEYVYISQIGSFFFLNCSIILQSLAFSFNTCVVVNVLEICSNLHKIRISRSKKYFQLFFLISEYWNHCCYNNNAFLSLSSLKTTTKKKILKLQSLNHLCLILLRLNVLLYECL